MTAHMINRERELAELRRIVDAAPSLVIMRGRRRVGKSFLLRNALEGDRVMSFQADEQPESGQLELLAREASRLLPGGPPLHFSQWRDALEFLAGQAAIAPLTVVLDEFQYLCASQPALPSLVQEAWDRFERERLPLTLILCGSALAFMDDLVGSGSPLHGRSGYRPLLQPLDFQEASGFTPRLGPVPLIERYAVLGGTPQYQVWGSERNLDDTIRRLILSPGGPLYEEPDHLIRKEDGIRDPLRYLGALDAIAGGRTRTGEIASRLGMDTGNASRLLERLARLGYVEQRSPIGDRRSRARSSWRVRDPFFRFWFRYVRPNRSRLEQWRVEEVLTDIGVDLPAHTGLVFEDCCRHWVGRYSALGQDVDAVGSWWSRDGSTEIDVVAARGSDYVLLGSCKWSRASVGAATLDALYEARSVLGRRAAQAQLVVFARSGFSAALRDRAARERVILVNAADLFAS